MKKSLLMALCIALAAALSIGGTMAYLQDSDSDVNVMTLGNVNIEQLEYERENTEGTAATTIKVFDEEANDNPLYPVVADKDFDYKSSTASIKWTATDDWDFNGIANTESAIWDPEKINNEVDKFVFVKNTGKSPAYIRTWFAFEMGALSMDEWKQLVHLNVNDTQWSWNTAKFTEATIDGARYAVCVVYYTENNGVLDAGDYSYPSLLQVALDKTAGNDTIASFGESYEIKVMSQAIQTAGFDTAATALMEGFTAYDPWEAGVEEALPWNGTADISWYNETDTEFVIMNAKQLAGLANLVDGGNTFAGKTIKLGQDIDLYADGDGEPISFEPIGSYEYDTTFNGTFDGQGHTISNMYQNGWALENGIYDGDDLGLGLFGKVKDSTIKNLTIDSANQPSEFNLIGSVAGAAYGECTFENITVTNSYMGNHSYYSGGIVGWASGDHKYINCDLDATNVISSQWGDFNNANGGIIGGAGSSGTYYFEDCDVACVIDAFNDVTSAYEWYAYRNVGMLIGNSGHTKVIDGTTYADAPNLTCVNCTVTYGDWANYTYCQFNAMGYPWVRVQAGESTHAYGNARYDYAKDANGNNVVDENHVHNEGEGHNTLLVLDQLYGGSQGGVYGTATHDGVTVIYNNK